LIIAHPRTLKFTSVKFEARGIVAPEEAVDGSRVVPDQLRNHARRLIAATQPHYFRRRSAQRRNISEVGIQGNDSEALASRERPDRAIIGLIESYLLHLRRFRADVRQQAAKPVAQVLVEQQLHTEATKMRRSRSAA
jgi:hypothetical protein